MHSRRADTQFSDPVVLLQAVAKTYAADSSTFRMEAIEESFLMNEFQRDWRKTYHSAIKGPGKQYRIETKSPFGSYIQVSDGETEWVSQIEEKVYVKRPASADGPTLSKLIVSGEMELDLAWRMRALLEGEAAQYKHATFLPEEKIQIEGRSFDCYVVHVTSNDRNKSAPEIQSETTIWIDKQAMVFRKKIEHIHSYMMASNLVHIPFDEERTTTYPVADLHPKLDAALFHYSPPVGSRRIASLEPEIRPSSTSSMIGEQAPDVQFSRKDGSVVSLKSYRGKPVLLDLWATWCGPCIMSMPSLARVYDDAKDKGLVMITVDQDSLPEDALNYLARHNYNWTNYHDDGKVEKAFQAKGIPLTVLIDSEGRIVYYGFGGDDAALRSAIAGLGPKFSSLKSAVRQ